MHGLFAIFNVSMWFWCDGKFGKLGGVLGYLNTPQVASKLNREMQWKQKRTRRRRCDGAPRIAVSERREQPGAGSARSRPARWEEQEPEPEQAYTNSTTGVMTMTIWKCDPNRTRAQGTVGSVQRWAPCDANDSDAIRNPTTTKFRACLVLFSKKI